MQNNKKRWIWVILGIVSLAAIGGLVYFFTKSKETKPSTVNYKATNEISFQKQLSIIKKAQQDLNQLILQHENILKERQKEAINLKQTSAQIKNTQKLEQHITELKAKKAKIERGGKL